MYSNNNLFKPVASITITWLKIHLIRLDQALIVLRQCRQKHDWRHMFKTVDPLSSLWPLTSDIHHSTGEKYSIVCASIGEGRGLCSRAAITENLINSYMYQTSRGLYSRVAIVEKVLTWIWLYWWWRGIRWSRWWVHEPWARPGWWVGNPRHRSGPGHLDSWRVGL